MRITRDIRGLCPERFRRQERRPLFRVERGVAFEEQVNDALRWDVRVTPCHARSVVPIHVHLGDHPARQKVRVLLTSGNRGEDVERGHVRVDLQDRRQMFEDVLLMLLREPDNVGKVAQDAVLLAEIHDQSILRRMVLRLASGKQHGAVEGFNPEEHLVAPRPRHEGNELRLLHDLRIALHEERDTQIFRDHRTQEMFNARDLVEVVRGEHDHAYASSLGRAKRLERYLQRLVAEHAPSELRDRAECAPIRTSAGGVDPHLRNHVTTHLLRCRRNQRLGDELALPPLRIAVRRP